jgi:hypothetical protein
VAAILLAAAAAMIFLSGCWGKDTRSEGTTHTKETTVTTPLANGGTVVEREVVTVDESQTKTTTKLEGVGALAAKLGGAAIGVATGTGGAIPWELIIGGATTLLAGGAGVAMQSRRAREHKEDAAEGWSKYEAAMKDRTNA